MKQTTVCIILVILLCGWHRQDKQLVINITGARNTKGHLLLSVYNSSNGFPDNADKACKKIKLTIQNGGASTSFNALPDGEYAVAILHDENDDAKMNTNWIGLPKEGFGFSNNAMGLMGPPSFSKAKVEYKGGVKQISIRLKYF